MNIANKLTLLRVFLIPVFMVCLILGSKPCLAAALIIFIVASATDFLDGHLARKYNLITNFGKFADPLADKLLVFSALCIFCAQSRISAVSLFIMLARELIVTGFRLIAVERGRVIAAAWSGKVKTCVQLIGIVIMLTAPLFAPLSHAPSYAGYSHAAQIVDFVIELAMVATTVYSGAEYIIKNSDILSDN